MAKVLVTVKEAAETLGVSPHRAWGMIREGELPAVKLGERTLRVHKDELTRFISDRSVPAGKGRG